MTNASFRNQMDNTSLSASSRNLSRMVASGLLEPLLNAYD